MVVLDAKLVHVRLGGRDLFPLPVRSLSVAPFQLPQGLDRGDRSRKHGGTDLIWLLCLVFALVYRLRFQFSVGFLLAAPVVVALPLGWLAAEACASGEQGRVVEEIRKLATEVSYDWQVNSDGFPQLDVACPRPAWLPTSLNDDFFGDVVAVTLEDGPFLDHALRNLSSLPRLQCFVLPFSNVTDDQLEPLRALTKLRVVVLSSERITGSAIMYLDGMDRLECLHLESTSVTDAGLSHLASAQGTSGLGA